MIEAWKDVVGYEGLYQVSNIGNIKSLHNYRGGNNILKKRIKNGYYCVGLRKNNVRKWYGIHRLVAKAFIHNPNNYPEVNHKDENKLNNNIDNLEWCTKAYNNCYGTRLERVYNTNKSKRAVIKYDLNGKYLEKYTSLAEAARKNNIKSVSSIFFCCQKKYKQANGFIFKYECEVMPNANEFC